MLAAIGEELGFVGLLCVACVFIIVAVRGFTAGLRAGSDYGFFLATAVTLFLVLPVLIMTAGMLGVVPLTGVVTPFLSYGGSAMVANFAALGVLTAIGSNAQFSTAANPFRSATKSLMALLGIGALGVIAVLLNVQVLRGDSYVVKPHLGVQSDGVRRFQYNQRVLDVAALIPRGTVTIEEACRLRPAIGTWRAARATSIESTASMFPAAQPVEERCYPLGGAAFHFLGDASNRRNWTASNTSYIERDAQDRLRGYKDYRELIPLLRHRYSTDHPDVKAFLDRKRDITTTIDAPLQARVASILSKYAARSATGHAAAVVLNPDNGQLLAIGSYPFPDANGEQSHEIGKRSGAAARSRAIWAVSSGLDVQAGHGSGCAAPRSRIESRDVHVRAAAERACGGENTGLGRRT